MPRPSPVRDALRGIFTAPEHRAWSLEDLQSEVRNKIGAGDYSTVFRAVAVLEEEGVVQKVELGDGLSRYEARGDHHEHVRCASCGKVAGVPGCVIEGAAREVEASTGFRLTGHSLVFSGLCPDCATV